MTEPLSRWTAVETLGRGVRAAPALRTGFGLTLTLALMGAGGRVVIPILVQQSIDRGFTPTDSQTNFLFIDIRRPSRGFREACAKDGVIIGRDFPPYEQTHARISVGTMAEMQRAVKVFDKVLAAPAKATAA